MNKFKSLYMTTVMLFFIGCSDVSVQDYAQNQPELIIPKFFDGNLTAHGVVKDYRGRVIRQFSADILAYWEDGIGTLEEDFIFDDGETDRRVWTLEPKSSGGYYGNAGDVVGAGDVNLAGDSAFLEYILRIPFNDGSLDVKVDDRMYLISPTILINESKLSKFGLKVGELLLVIEKQS